MVLIFYWAALQPGGSMVQAVSSAKISLTALTPGDTSDTVQTHCLSDGSPVAFVQ